MVVDLENNLSIEDLDNAEALYHDALEIHSAIHNRFVYLEEDREPNFDVIVSSEESDEEVAGKLELSPDNFDVALTMIGGARIGNEAVQGAVDTFLQLGIDKINRHLDDRNMRLLVGAAATSTGVMRIIGDARYLCRRNKRDFTLLGIIPVERVIYPGNPRLDREDWAYLRRIQDLEEWNRKFSHLVVTKERYSSFKESAWRTMSDRLCDLTNYLGSNSVRKTIVVNGGEGTGYELPQKLAQGDKVILVKGTGRFTDALICLFESNDINRLTPDQREYIDRFLYYCGKDLEHWRKNITIFNLFKYKDIDKATEDFKNLVLND